jgi:protein-tyrosine phosphatase
MIDTHNHILPGLDDGVQDLEQALATAKLAVEDGINGVICTPHWVNGIFRNTRIEVLKSIEILKRHLEEHEVPLVLYPGMELRIDFDMARKIREGDLLTLNDSGCYALVELPAEVIPPKVEDFFYTLQMDGITPIVAHPERNLNLLDDPARLYAWLESGILVQLTARSLLGRFGSDIKRFSVVLLEHGMVHLIATDAHGPTHRTPRMAEAVEATKEIVGEGWIDRIIYKNPVAVLEGKAIVPFELQPLTKQSTSPLRKFFSFLGWWGKRKHPLS